MIKIIAKILFAIAMIWTLVFVFKIGNSFALSPEYKKEIYNNCYQDAKTSLGEKRAKQYCACTTTMLDNKYSDKDILKIGQKSEAEQLQAFEFATNHCNKNANASKSMSSNANELGSIYEFKECWFSHFNSYEDTLHRWSSFTFKIDLQKQNIYEQRIHTDSILKKWKKSKEDYNKKYGYNRPTRTEKYQIEEFEILNISESVIMAKIIESSGVVYPDDYLFFNLNNGTFETTRTESDGRKIIQDGKCDIRPKI